jgi:hypothetical protein
MECLCDYGRVSLVGLEEYQTAKERAEVSWVEVVHLMALLRCVGDTRELRMQLGREVVEGCGETASEEYMSAVA